MSNRSLIELNHDYCPRDQDLTDWADDLRTYLLTGDKTYLPPGMILIGTRHHSEPEFELRDERRKSK